MSDKTDATWHGREAIKQPISAPLGGPARPREGARGAQRGAQPSGPWSLPCGCSYQPGKDLPTSECTTHAVDEALIHPEPGGLVGAYETDDALVLPLSEPMPERSAFSFAQLVDLGLLWHINAHLLNIAGIALGFDYADGDPEPRGWHLIGDYQPIRLALTDAEVDVRQQDVDALFAQARDRRRAPDAQP